MIEKDALNEKLGINNFFKTFKFRRDFAKNNPTYFNADGVCIFVGPQGSGKTLSAVNYVYKLLQMYPRCKLVTNLMLKDYRIVTFKEYLGANYGKLAVKSLENNKFTEFGLKNLMEEYRILNRVFPFNNNDDFITYSNLDEGVIYLVDEIQLYLNSLESKNVNMDIVTEISQQRKQRKHIVATSQVFGRMAKPLREQFNSVILCKNYLSCLQVNKLLLQDDIEQSSDDMHLHGKVAKKVIYFHSPSMYKRYDTYYKISRNKFISNEHKRGDIYERDSIK